MKSVLWSFTIITILLVGCKEIFNNVEIEKLEFEKYNETLYLKRVMRELNYEVVVISKSKRKIFDPNKRKEYVFTAATSRILYKQTLDSLVLYVNVPTIVPFNFETNVIIQQIETDNQKRQLLLKNHKDRGIKIF
ncbi:MAG: hypothetical protein AAF620_18085 [Bacteroidota bacterium]